MDACDHIYFIEKDTRPTSKHFKRVLDYLTRPSSSEVNEKKPKKKKLNLKLDKHINLENLIS